MSLRLVRAVEQLVNQDKVDISRMRGASEKLRPDCTTFDEVPHPGRLADARGHPVWRVIEEGFDGQNQFSTSPD
jgi:hypothetical protein